MEIFLCENYVHLANGIRRHYTLEIYLPLTEVVENFTTAAYLRQAGDKPSHTNVQGK